MSILLITGSGGLIGSEAVKFFSRKFTKIIGIDNDMRSYFFGKSASVKKNIAYIKKNFKNYQHYNIDIRNFSKLKKIFKKFNNKISFVIHSAAQPSHDWAVRQPHVDYSINSTGTLNILENIRLNCPNAKLAHLSTNKVYGDRPNTLKIIETKKRYDLKKNDKFYNKGVNESMSIDDCKHSLFGASKLSGDIYCQEYLKYFNLKIGIFRAGCLTGPLHKGAELHGFLSYLIKMAKEKKTYKVFGYKGKQVRDNIHSEDVVSALWEFYKVKNNSGIYNMGGGRKNSCSILEIIDTLKKKYKIQMKYKITKTNRIGDHIWYISDMGRFRKKHKNWKINKTLNQIVDEMIKN
jgi:CDP-paratose 2-epimerase